MHYEANALFWWEHYLGARAPDRYARIEPGESGAAYGLRLFKSTIVFGAIFGEAIPNLEASMGDVRVWLRSRLPDLLAQMHRDLKGFE